MATELRKALLVRIYRTSFLQAVVASRLRQHPTSLHIAGGKHIGVRLPIVGYVMLAKVQAAPVECNRSWHWRWAQLIPTISLDANSTLHYVFYVSSWCTMVGNPSLTKFNTKSLPFATARSQFLCNSPNFWTRRSASMRASLFTMGYHGYYHYSVSCRPKTSNMQKLVGFGVL